MESANIKKLLIINKKLTQAGRELLTIRGNTTELKEDFDTYGEIDRTIKLMKKKKCPLFMRITSKDIVVGRTFDNELLDMYKLKVMEAKGSGEFDILPAEFSSKYFLVVQNCSDKRLENLMIDVLHQRSHVISLDNTRYAWIFSCVDGRYILKYVRVCSNYVLEDIGPLFVLEIVSKYNCEEEKWNEATKVEKNKKVKNVEKNVCNDRIGKVHIDKQDLKDIRLKKGRGYKSR